MILLFEEFESSWGIVKGPIQAVEGVNSHEEIAPYESDEGSGIDVETLRKLEGRNEWRIFVEEELLGKGSHLSDIIGWFSTHVLAQRARDGKKVAFSDRI